MKKLLLALAILLLTACSTPKSEPLPTAVPDAQTETSTPTPEPAPEAEAETDGNDAILEAACLTQGGVWVMSSKECEGLSQVICEDLGGTFNECASACRNQPEAQICTLQCVIVCEF